MQLHSYASYRAEVVMLTISCIILFRISFSSPIFIHYSQIFSQDYCQDNPGALKIVEHDYNNSI